MEIEKGLRIRIAPQGITGTNYLEIDYVDPKANPELPISWEPDHVYIPSAQFDVHAVLRRRRRRGGKTRSSSTSTPW